MSLRNEVAPRGSSVSNDQSLCLAGEEALALFDSLLAQGVSIRVQVTGRSMEPTIVSGDYIVVEPITGPVHVGDIVLCRHAQAIVGYVHRIVWRQGGCWRTKGDALKSLDPPISRERLLGRVVAIEREGASIRDLRSPGERVRGPMLACWSLGLAAIRRWIRSAYSASSCF